MLIWFGAERGHYDGEMLWHHSSEETRRRFPSSQVQDTHPFKKLLLNITESEDMSSALLSTPLEHRHNLFNSVFEKEPRFLWMMPKNVDEEVMKSLISLESRASALNPKLRIFNKPSQAKIISKRNDFISFMRNEVAIHDILPRSFVLSKISEAELYMSEVGLPFVLKAEPSHGGKGIFLIKNQRDLDRLSNKLAFSKFLPFGGNLERLRGFKNWSMQEYVDTYSERYQCFVAAAIYLFNGRVVFANPRLSTRGFNIHARTGAEGLENLADNELTAVCSEVFRLVRSWKAPIEAALSSLSFPLLRIDCGVDLNQSRLVIFEAEIKGGPLAVDQARTIPRLAQCGWSIRKIRDYLEAGTTRPESILE